MKRRMKKGHIITRKFDRSEYIILKNPDPSCFIWRSGQNFFRIKSIKYNEEFVISERDLQQDFLLLNKTKAVE